jgi:hypothetical protein
MANIKGTAMSMLSGEQIAQKIQPVLNLRQKIWNEVYALMTLGEDWYYPQIEIAPFNPENCEKNSYRVTINPDIKTYNGQAGIEEKTIPENDVMPIPPRCYVRAQILPYYESSKYSIEFVPIKETAGFRISTVTQGPGRDFLGRRYNQLLQIYNPTDSCQYLTRKLIVGYLRFYKKSYLGK